MGKPHGDSRRYHRRRRTTTGANSTTRINRPRLAGVGSQCHWQTRQTPIRHPLRCRLGHRHTGIRLPVGLPPHWTRVFLRRINARADRRTHRHRRTFRTEQRQAISFVWRQIKNRRGRGIRRCLGDCTGVCGGWIAVAYNDGVVPVFL